jgi:putative SOS response-associated peptidase YedK
MCGRFTLALNAEGIQLAFPWLDVPEKVIPRYNVAPSQPVAVVANDGRSRLDFHIWGLIPFWAKDPAIGARMINARAETLAEKPAFKAAYRYRRCLILADGFYEWKKGGGSGKSPSLFRLASGNPFAFAGIWERWMSPFADEVLTCSIITTEANSLVAETHDRMPVILHDEDYPLWLTPGEMAPTALAHLLRPFPADEMIAVRVSDRVNNARVDDPECVLPNQEPLL